MIVPVSSPARSAGVNILRTRLVSLRVLRRSGRLLVRVVSLPDRPVPPGTILVTAISSLVQFPITVIARGYIPNLSHLTGLFERDGHC